jgi:hypothetical protein
MPGPERAPHPTPSPRSDEPHPLVAVPEPHAARTTWDSALPPASRRVATTPCGHNRKKAMSKAVLIRVCVPAEDKREIEARAKRAGMSLSAYLRDRTLENDVSQAPSAGVDARRFAQMTQTRAADRVQDTISSSRPTGDTCPSKAMHRPITFY